MILSSTSLSKRRCHAYLISLFAQYTGTLLISHYANTANLKCFEIYSLENKNSNISENVCTYIFQRKIRSQFHNQLRSFLPIQLIYVLYFSIFVIDQHFIVCKTNKQFHRKRINLFYWVEDITLTFSIVVFTIKVSCI